MPRGVGNVGKPVAAQGHSTRQFQRFRPARRRSGCASLGFRPVAYQSIHCNLIQSCCNAIQTLLKRNSNNSSHLWVWSVFCSARSSAVQRGVWRVLSRPSSPKFGPTCAELIFSIQLSSVHNLLKNQHRLFVSVTNDWQRACSMIPLALSY